MMATFGHEPLAQRTLDEPLARLEMRFENGGAHLL